MPDKRPGYGRPALLLGIVALIGVATMAGFLAGRRVGKTGPADATAERPASPAVTDIAGFIAALAGSWEAPDERLLIKRDKDVIEILRETRLGNGQVRLDQYAVAPLRLDAEQKRLSLDTPDGVWQLALLPGARRAQLSITYPDRRNVLYQ